MKKITMCTLSFLMLLSMMPSFAQQKGKGKAPALPGVAVLNFTNNSGDSTLKSLSFSIPEAISVNLAQVDGIRVVERNNVGKLLNEIEMQQSGLFDEADAAKVGKMTKADVLILGSISGNESNLIVTIKAIEVSTGKVLDGKVVQGNQQRIFDLVKLSSLSMGAIISGKNIGYINVSTNPDGCDIFIDGIQIGKSPIIDYKVVTGSHRIVAVKSDFIEADTNVSVEANGREQWSPTLAPKLLLNRSEIGLSIFGYVPFSSKIKTGYLTALHFGKTYENIYIGAALNYQYFRHDQNISTPFGKATQERRLILGSSSFHLNVIPFKSLRYFSPYGGVFVDLGFHQSGHKVKNEWEKEPEGTKFAYALGLTAGVNLIPYSKVSIFAEGRFYYYPKDFDRGEYRNPGGFLGALQYDKKTVSMSGIALGGGVKYYFD